MSLPEEDVELVDRYARQGNADSRSSVLHQALELLRSSELEEAYISAWDEWEASEDAELWDSVSADGTGDAAR